MNQTELLQKIRTMQFEQTYRMWKNRKWRNAVSQFAQARQKTWPTRQRRFWTPGSPAGSDFLESFEDAGPLLTSLSRCSRPYLENHPRKRT